MFKAGQYKTLTVTVYYCVWKNVSNDGQLSDSDDSDDDGRSASDQPPSACRGSAGRDVWSLPYSATCIQSYR